MTLLVDLRPLLSVPELVVGVDAAYLSESADGQAQRVVGAAVVVDWAAATVLEDATAVVTTTVGYQPGKLGLRESPAVVAAIAKLNHMPTLVVCDGHGYAHPTRSGLACHVGVELGIPTIGCAKNHLIGDYEPVGPNRGDWSPLIDGGEVIGAVVRTQTDIKPVFVSPGHLADVETSVDAILKLAKRYRLPETTRAADQLANRTRKSLEEPRAE